MVKKRIYQLAKEINKSSKYVVNQAKLFGLSIKNHMSVISYEEEQRLIKRLQKNKEKTVVNLSSKVPKILEYTKATSVLEIAKKLDRKPSEVIKQFFKMGIIVTPNQFLSKEKIKILAKIYGIKYKEKIKNEIIDDITDIDKFFKKESLMEGKLITRPPIVTIMGHVDHGKTTLLDTLRNSFIANNEFGGITQHIGAYQINVDKKIITFLDTPGHEAFSNMRARGAGITDITVLVVAADDGVMPQTIEAINHSKAAKVPIIVAINKIDKESANPQKVMQELSDHGLVPEIWGGETIFLEISAKFKKNIQELLEMILLLAEMEDLKANPDKNAIGTVIEARLDKGRGPVATLLVQNGTLCVGNPIVVNNTYGRIRVMTNDIGCRIKKASPGMPVEVTGLNSVPNAGDHFVVYPDEKTARFIGEERAKIALVQSRKRKNDINLDNLLENFKKNDIKHMHIIIKADAQGSVEALVASLKNIDIRQIKIDIIHAGVGAINESDISLAVASKAIIIGFNVHSTIQAKKQLETNLVDIRLHKIIYKVIEEIKIEMTGMMDPTYKEKITGQMNVKEIFEVSKIGTIAGCFVTEGFIRFEGGIRVIRDGIIIHQGKLLSMKHFKNDIKEVKIGIDCGVRIENFNDIKINDVIEGHIMEKNED